MFEWMANPEAWIALGTLTALEIVLGIDNIIFITILVSRVNADERGKARNIGLILAMLTRIVLLFSLSWVMTLTQPIFTALGNEISGRDLILLIGGLFLLAKSTHEIHKQMEGNHTAEGAKKSMTFFSAIVQISIIDIVFSLDSVITAVGLAKDIEVMIIAVVISVLVMIAAAKSIGDFVDEHPTIKVLALSFLLLVGTTLIGEGLDFHIPKGYIYFAMAFSMGVEFINLKIRKKKDAQHGTK